jgi:hypothetical protein
MSERDTRLYSEMVRTSHLLCQVVGDKRYFYLTLAQIETILLRAEPDSSNAAIETAADAYRNAAKMIREFNNAALCDLAGEVEKLASAAPAKQTPAEPQLTKACNEERIEGGRTLTCELPKGHSGTHQDGMWIWKGKSETGQW